MKRLLLTCGCILLFHSCFCWGFFAHKKINFYAVFLLPPEMLVLYKPNIDFISSHAVDPDKRRYLLAGEGARHFLDIDHYGLYPFDSLPRKWNEALARFSEDTLNKYGIVPWWIQIMLQRLTTAFKEKNKTRILKLSADIGHYISDAHVPLHATQNHNGQLTGQEGIHAFWESRIPELFAETEWDFLLGRATYISNPSAFIWKRFLESAAAADTVLRVEKELSLQMPPDKQFAFENRNGLFIKQYSTAYSNRYDQLLKGMIERRMQESIFAVASFWYTAWVNAGQPDLKALAGQDFDEEELKEIQELNDAWEKLGAHEHN
jgi:hypothetical protein